MSNTIAAQETAQELSCRPSDFSSLFSDTAVSQETAQAPLQDPPMVSSLFSDTAVSQETAQTPLQDPPMVSSLSSDTVVSQETERRSFLSGWAAAGRKVLLGIGVLLVIGLLISTCGAATSTEMPEYKESTQTMPDLKVPAPLEMGQQSSLSEIYASGRLMPAAWADLSSSEGGTVVELLVAPGEQITAGMPLVRLDTTELNISLQIAQQEVGAWQAQLDRLSKGASSQMVSRAEKDNSYQIAQAEIVLQNEQEQLQQAFLHDPAKDVDVAQARVRQLELQVAQARVLDPAPRVTAAGAEVERARIALDDTQNEYNMALDRPWQDQWIRDEWARRLEQAQLDYRVAQAKLDVELNEQAAHGIGISALAAGLQEAQILLSQAIDEQKAYTSTLNVLDAHVRTAQLQLEYLRTWENPYLDKASDEEIAEAKARVQQAVLAVAQIEQRIKSTEVRAPFDGVVSVVHTRMGESVARGQALVTVADMSTLRIETIDLDELDVARVRIDQRVAVAFDAFPDRVFDGRVVHIAPVSLDSTHGNYYTVVVELEESEPALRLGMTGLITIQAIEQ